MFKIVESGKFVVVGSCCLFFWVKNYYFQAGKVRIPARSNWSSGQYKRIMRMQVNTPIRLGGWENRTYWMFRNYTVWENEGLSADAIGKVLMVLTTEGKKQIQSATAKLESVDRDSRKQVQPSPPQSEAKPDSYESSLGAYGHRGTSAYDYSDVNPKFAQNPHILKWWSQEHDKLLLDRISKMHWTWYHNIHEIIIQNTEPSTIGLWRLSDPKCKRWSWYNVLLYFAFARAQELHYTDRIREPQWRKCPLCGFEFREDSLPYPLVERFGVDRLIFCSPCLAKSVLQSSGSNTSTNEQITQYLRDLASALKRVPNQNFGVGMSDFVNLNDQERLNVLRVLTRKPSIERVKEVFGSWLNALIQAEILEDGTRKTSRGIQTLARDGHMCLSLGEKTIDEFLFEHQISHSKELHYPDSNYRTDFEVNGVFIEYFGLTGNPQYDAKTAEKRKLCLKHNIELIAIFPADLASEEGLRNKLSPLLNTIVD